MTISNKRDNQRSLGLRSRDSATYGDKLQQSIIKIADGQFRFRDFELSSTALVTVPENAVEADYNELGFALAGLDSASRFWIGDWANLYTVGMSDDETSAVYDKLAEEFNLEASTIKDRAYVCRNVDASLRNDAKSFSHCKAVAGLSHDEQKYWLQESVQNDWGVAKLRGEIKKADSSGSDTSAKIATHLKPIQRLADSYSDEQWNALKKSQKLEIYTQLKRIVEQMSKEFEK
jgi:hypothetical protein